MLDNLEFKEELRTIIPEKLQQLSVDIREIHQQLNYRKFKRLKYFKHMQQPACELTMQLVEAISDRELVAKVDELIKERRRFEGYAFDLKLRKQPKGRIDPREVETILIKDLYKGKLKKFGKHLVGKCPLHEEKTPSFRIYPANNFYCYGCGKGGNVITYVMILHDLSFVEALKYLKGL